jgi:GTP-binding protein YchF
MSFSIGIVGLPNVGKSTLFKALTKKQIEIANFPFTTINPNVGVVKVPDERLEKLAEVLHPKEIISTHIEFVDIAGLVKGAHQGEGLGNQFLSHIREVDALVEVVRDFHDPNVTHVAGAIDPQSDMEVINLELIFADLMTIEKRLEKTRAEARSGDKEAQKLLAVLEKIKKGLDAAKPVRDLEFNDEEKEATRDLNLLTTKPIIFVLNIDENEIRNSKSEILNKFKIQNSKFKIALCAKLEAELADLPDEEAENYLQEYGLERSGLDELIANCHRLLNLITFFTCQNQILQAWTIEQGATALEAASKIHTDFGRTFVRAEVVGWRELVQCGSEQSARDKGILQTQGRDYIVQDGDVIHCRTGR